MTTFSNFYFALLNCSNDSGEEAGVNLHDDNRQHSTNHDEASAELSASSADNLNFFKRSKSMCFVPEAESNPFEVSLVNDQFQFLILVVTFCIFFKRFFFCFQI